MAYASDKLYSGYIRRNMSRLASDVKVREIVAHLPCLTQSDREEIEAKRETAGNYNAMMLLLDNLRRRENWPDEFIRALRDTEQRVLSEEIQKAYDEIRGISAQSRPPASAHPPTTVTSTVASSPTTVSPPAPTSVTASPSPAPAPAPVAASAMVTTATIHNVPPLLTPSPLEELVQLSDPSSINPPPESHPNTNVSEKADVPAEVPVPTQPPPEPVAHMERPVPVSSSQIAPNASDIALNVPPALEQNEATVSSTTTSTISIPDHIPLTGLLESSLTLPPLLSSNSVNSSLSESSSASTASQPTLAPENSQVSATEGFISAKHPIQDSNPPQKVHISADNPTKSSTVFQVEESVQTTTSPAAEATHMQSRETAPASDNTVAGPVSPRVSGNEYFSKPGALIEERSCSITSDELEISTSIHITTETGGASPVQSARSYPVSNLQDTVQIIQEPCSVSTNDGMLPQATATSSTTKHAHDPPSEKISCHAVIAPQEPVEDSYSSHNQPVEDHYESFFPNLQSDQGTLFNVGQVSEEPSIQNLNGQPPSMFDSNQSIHEPKSLLLSSQTESHLSAVDQSVIPEQDNEQEMQGNNILACEHSSPGVHLPAYAEPPTSAGITASGQINTDQAEQQEESENPQEVMARVQPDLRVFAVAAAAIGVTAAFVAWKFKY